jgi:hypothetical protein
MRIASLISLSCAMLAQADEPNPKSDQVTKQQTVVSGARKINQPKCNTSNEAERQKNDCVCPVGTDCKCRFRLRVAQDACWLTQDYSLQPVPASKTPRKVGTIGRIEGATITHSSGAQIESRMNFGEMKMICGLPIVCERVTKPVHEKI